MGLPNQIPSDSALSSICDISGQSSNSDQVVAKSMNKIQAENTVNFVRLKSYKE